MPLSLDEGERRLLSLLTSEPQHIDEIAAAAHRPIQETASQLLLLEIKGLVRNTGAQYYARV
jgi:predicted Rossmann fold nucleotide-binding protein DprA/Smf involved in DNA uptake